MHEFTKDVEELAQEILAYSLERLKSDPPLDGPRTAQDLFDEGDFTRRFVIVKQGQVYSRSYP